MCGRVFVKSTIPEMVRRFEFAHPGDVERLGNGFPVWNGAPSLTYPSIVREELYTSMAGFVSAKWGWFPAGRAMAAGGHRLSMRGARRLPATACSEKHTPRAVA